MSIDDLADRSVPPSNVASLRALIRDVARSESRDVRLMEIAYAGVIVSQMLPGVMRGGQGLKVRIGPTRTRFSEDMDLVLPHDVRPEQFDDWLEQGARTWGDFRPTRVERWHPDHAWHEAPIVHGVIASRTTTREAPSGALLVGTGSAAVPCVHGLAGECGRARSDVGFHDRLPATVD